MPPIISHSERQRIESSPTQITSPQSLRSCVPVAFKSSQPPPVPSLTPPPPRHYLRNTTSSEKLQVFIQKRSEIYTRVQQAQQEEVDCSHPSARSQAHAADPESKVRPIQLTRSSSFTLGASVGAYTAQITRSASWKATGSALGRRGRSYSIKSPTKVHGARFDSLCAQRRETMVLGLSEVDAHFRNKFDSGDGASVAAQPVHYEPPHPNHGELEFKGVLGLTTTAEQKHVEIEMPACNTQGSIYDSTPTLDQDVVDLDDNKTVYSHHTQHSYLALPSPFPLSTPHTFILPQRRQDRTPQSFPPPRGSSLVGYSQSLDPYPSGRPPADSRDSHTRGKNVSHKIHSKSEGRRTISKAIRDLRDRLRSNACTSAPGSHVTLGHPRK